MEIWAYCHECGRWFYCPEWFDQAEPQPVCPACYREPSAIENRAGGHATDSGSSTHDGGSVSDRGPHQPVGF